LFLPLNIAKRMMRANGSSMQTTPPSRSEQPALVSETSRTAGSGTARGNVNSSSPESMLNLAGFVQSSFIFPSLLSTVSTGG
jgi:hypothetical protein